MNESGACLDYKLCARFYNRYQADQLVRLTPAASNRSPKTSKVYLIVIKYRENIIFALANADLSGEGRAMLHTHLSSVESELIELTGGISLN